MKKKRQNKVSEFEFIALMALLMANVAMSIDSILPGLSSIGASIGNPSNTDLQLLITMIFLGLGFGQLIFGTLSDSLGRKPTVYWGFTIFIISSFLCLQSENLELMLLGRVLQGVGLAAARTISVSIVRDLYVGDYMARIMSFVAVIFILIPMLAPIIGQQILFYFSWQAIFYFQILFAAVVWLWFYVRQEETLVKSKRIKLTSNIFIDGTKEFFKHKKTILYTAVTGVLTGCFMVFLSASKQIFQDQYLYQDEYVYIIAGISFFLGLATLLNGNLVLRFGMKKLSTRALYVFCFVAFLYSALFFNKSNPSIYVIAIFLGLQFMSLGFIFGNIRALTMEPIGHIAGIGAALSGFISTVIAVPIAIFIGSFINFTALPLFIGFFSCSLLSLVIIYFSSKKD